MRAISSSARIGKVCARRASSVGDAGSALGGMLVLGFIAAADVSAGPAQAQMHPGISHLDAFLAAFAARPVGPHQTEVTALHFSRCTSPRLRAAGRAPGTHRRRFRARRAAGAKDPSTGPAPPGLCQALALVRSELALLEQPVLFSYQALDMGEYRRILSLLF